jgi:D-glycero-alpha-D-manno-heptose-7-phosphate kinase
MIITQTPFRVSFVGGGSDMAAFYTRHPGAVLSTTINRYMYISSHRFFEPDKIRAKYAKTETVNRAEELEHPIIRAVLEKLNIRGGIEVSSIADVPSGTGMGSSSSFTVGLLHNLHTWLGHTPTKEELASGACEIEIDLLREPIGKQDQYAAAYGGFNIFRFGTDGAVHVEPIALSAEVEKTLHGRLHLFYTGTQRSASAILAEQSRSISAEDKFQNLKAMTALVDPLRDCLLSGNLDDFGRILHENWMLKQQLTGAISTPEIDEAYRAALAHGALGGKLLGAGGGGFLLFYCPEGTATRVKQALHHFRYFEFEFEHEGSKLIYSSK